MGHGLFQRQRRHLSFRAGSRFFFRSGAGAGAGAVGRQHGDRQPGGGTRFAAVRPHLARGEAHRVGARAGGGGAADGRPATPLAGARAVAAPGTGAAPNAGHRARAVVGAVERSAGAVGGGIPVAEVDVLSAPQNDALRMLHDGSAQLALIYERPQIDQRESFQELGSEVLVAVISPRHPQARERNGQFRLEDLIDMRQIAIVSRDARIEDERVLISRKLWRTDSHLATLSLVRAGVGWAYLPHRLAAPLLDAGELLGIGFAHMSNQVRLWVDVVWLNDRPLGLGAQRLIALMKDIAGLEARPA